jgi:hypothetical protein
MTDAKSREGAGVHTQRLAGRGKMNVTTQRERERIVAANSMGEGHGREILLC